jgi:hypothetical protein
MACSPEISRNYAGPSLRLWQVRAEILRIERVFPIVDQGKGWDMDRIHATMNGTPNQQVNLAKPIPVLILYSTVIVTEDGINLFLLFARRGLSTFQFYKMNP